MPITSRLSRRLYETFGDEAAADLVDWMHHVDAQRTELRELNEFSFQRLEARIAQSEAAMDARFARFESAMDTRFAQVETRLEARFGALDAKIEQKAADLMKWMLVFWVGAVGSIAALAGVLG